MKLAKNPLSFLYIVAFIYLVMCPSVHQLGDNIRHDVILKVKVYSQQDNYNNDYNFHPLRYANKLKIADIDQIRTCAFVFFQSSLPDLDISTLSTVKLIL
jgi:hypothetical protein